MPESITETSGSNPSQPEKYSVRARWAIPQRLDVMTFIGKDVLAVAQDVEIIFYNFKNNTETVYIANNALKGDGVDCIAGHRTTIFAFAEKIKPPRIFIVAYPSMTILNELKDSDVNRYKGLCMCESDTIAAFSGFPNYLVSVWSWRTGQRLLQLPTGVVRRQQIYMSSRTHLLICQCWGEGLTVWEVAQCYKKCLMMKRTKQEKTGWEVSEPPLVGVCWSSEGQLYAIDPKGNLFSVLSDGIGMLTSLEWSAEDIPGSNKPCICSFGNGLLIYGPDNYLRALKKCDDKWKISSSFSPLDTVARLVSNSSSDVAVMWTDAGCVYRITGDEEKILVSMVAFKQRNIKKIQMLAPEYKRIAMIDDRAAIGIYEMINGKLVTMKFVEGENVMFQASPVDPLLAVFGKVGSNYGMKLVAYSNDELENISNVCLTHQIVSHVAFSPPGRALVAAAMSAGHIFIYSLSPGPDCKLTLVRYAELGRGLADCFLMRVGEAMRCFSLVLFSDKYLIGERIICINAESGRDNKFAGKMAGPYSRLLPLSAADTMLAVPHLSRSLHLLKLSGEKGVTVSVKMGPIIDSGHDLKLVNGFFNFGALLTFGYDGTVILRQPHAPEEYELKLVASHRYESGIAQATIDASNQVIATLAGNKTVVVHYLNQDLAELREDAKLETPAEALLEVSNNTLSIISANDKNYLDIQEDKKVHEEAMDYRKQREEVVKNFTTIQEKLVELLEENLREVPLHQLSLSEFNLHMEHKKERLKLAEKEREKIRLKTESRIKAQDKVTAWIKKTCWDTMITPRVKLFAMFTHYQVENYAVLPTQMSNWPELQQVEAIRSLEMENDEDLLKPWEEPAAEPSYISLVSTLKLPTQSVLSVKDRTMSMISQHTLAQVNLEESIQGEPYVLSGSYAHKFITPPAFSIPQTLTFSFMHMYYIQHIARLNVQNMRLWFNKQFDELVSLKKREVALVEERNSRLRFIVEELNKLSDLRGSFHHLIIQISDPEWRQEEQPHRLIKVEPEECSIEPYISPSQIVIVPPDPGPKDDFRERALIEMMDGVLEKLWHEEIKKPIPKPQCMLDKDPEHFNEDDLRLVFDYEAKVAFREAERDKYRKMLHAEYSRLAAVLDEGIVKFNQKVKEMWLTKLQVDSVIGQETLNMMRLRRVNLDRVELAEKLEEMRDTKYRYEDEIESLKAELEEIQAQGDECQATYDALSLKDKHMEKTFKNHFADLSPVIVDQCYKYYKKRPKWHQRAAMTPAVLNDLANAILLGFRQPFMHPDCVEYSRNMDQLDLLSNMPAVMDEPLWAATVKLRRAKVENEIRMRAIVQEMAFVDSASNVWNKSIMARRQALAKTVDMITEHRADVELTARNKTIQIVLPAGQVEIHTTGHMVDYEDATLILRSDIEAINNAILKVGEMKLRMMRKQMEFRKGILSKEWEHAQWRLRLRHTEQELYSYRRLKIPKELQQYLKNKELGCTDEQDYVRLEKELEASRRSVERVLQGQVRRVEETEMKINAVDGKAANLENMIATLNVKVSEKRLNEDPLEPIRVRKIYKKRMESLVQRSQLIREVQGNHTAIVLLQTELELLRLKTFPTLATFQTFQ